MLGVPVAHVHVIEFQKRSLPHCHMFIILCAEDKLSDRKDIDNKRATQTLVRMEDARCNKNFPKEFRNKTLENVNGYPAYRRRNNARTVQTGSAAADNRFVVPHNSQLLKKYKSHINLEARASIKSVKYLFNKGHDCANTELAVSRSGGTGESASRNPQEVHDKIIAGI